MRFLLHGSVPPEAQAALAKHEHHVHSLEELAGAEVPEVAADPELLLALLQKKQWQLFTTDSALIQKIYEAKMDFPGIIVLLLEGAGGAGNDAVDRLFERYPRLTPRRLYTVTPSRVKIRQLPGAAQA